MKGSVDIPEGNQVQALMPLHRRAWSHHSRLRAGYIPCVAGAAYGARQAAHADLDGPAGAQVVLHDAMRKTSPLSLAPGGSQDMLRVDSFKVKYRADGSVEQFVSGLSVLDEAGQLQQHQGHIRQPPAALQGVPLWAAAPLSCCRLVAGRSQHSPWPGSCIACSKAGKIVFRHGFPDPTLAWPTRFLHLRRGACWLRAASTPRHDPVCSIWC